MGNILIDREGRYPRGCVASSGDSDWLGSRNVLSSLVVSDLLGEAAGSSASAVCSVRGETGVVGTPAAHGASSELVTYLQECNRSRSSAPSAPGAHGIRYDEWSLVGTGA